MNPSASNQQHPLVKLTGICKSFGGQMVLDRVDLDLHAGEVHVLAGENGAGKSTLMNILGGVHQPDAGTIALAGAPSLTHFRSVHDAARAGVAMIHQELSLAPSMSVMDNLFLGVERTIGRSGWLDRRAQWREAVTVLRRVGLEELDPARPVGSLPLAARQLIEIAKALLRDARIVVMDEPTSALAAPDVDRLFTLIGELKANRLQPTAIVFITHRMEEIYRLADRITVLRDGRRVVTAPARDLSREDLVQAMVGRAMHTTFTAEHAETAEKNDSDSAPQSHRAPRSNDLAHGLDKGSPLLRLEGVSVLDGGGRGWGRGLAVQDVSFAVASGEIVGLAGLQGSGAGALLHALFGDGRIVAGQISINGQPTRIAAPRGAMKLGMALLTEDRKITGLCQDLSVGANLTLPSVRELAAPVLGVRRIWRERSAARRAIEDFGIRCRGSAQVTRTLSGGNQQKVALGKWLMRRPSILLLHDPTRGVDIGARQEIYRLIGQATAAGAAVLMASSDLPELLGLADRVVVLHRGRVTAILNRDDATPQRVIAAAMGQIGREGVKG